MKKIISLFVLNTLLITATHAQNKAPNAVEKFKDAAELMKSDSSDFVSSDISVKRAAVTKNADALRALRQGFAYEYSHTLDVNKLDSEYSKKTRALARLLVAEGELNLADGKKAEAVNSFLDAIRLGQEVSRGEPILGALVANAVEAIGRRPLWDNIAKFDADSARYATLRLQLLNARRHPYAATLRIEQEFGEKSLANVARKLEPAQSEKLMTEYRQLIKQEIEDSTRPYVFDEQKTHMDVFGEMDDLTSPDVQIPLSRALFNEQRFNDAKSRALNSLLAVSLALHSWKLDKGNYPEKLEELAPRYLEQIPRDSFGVGEPLRYKKKAESYVLYSVGPDGQDDLGRAISDAKTKNIEAKSNGDIVAGVNIR